MIYIADAGAAGFHFGAADGVVVVYNNGHEVTRAVKLRHMIQVAKDCTAGGLTVTVDGEPVQIVDQAWLLRLGARCCDLAAGAI